MTKLFVVREGEDNPKKCTAMRLAKFGLVELVDKPVGVLLNPFAEKFLSPADKPAELTALDVSWNLLESFLSFFVKHGGRGPRLFLFCYVEDVDCVAFPVWIRVTIDMPTIWQLNPRGGGHGREI